MDLEKALTVGQLAQRSGVSVSALHFYEAKGLIRSVRTPGNQRRYPREILRRVSVIKLSSKWKTQLEERINLLVRLRDQLDGCIGCGCLSIRNCWLRNPWDKLAQEGPGPRLLERG